MLISVIIPTCNRNDLLAKCLQLLSPDVQSADPASYEVIVTDDSKLDEAKAMIETGFPWVKWVAGPKRGPAANRNSGASFGQAGWLVFIDDDCLPEKDILENYSRAFAAFPTQRAFEGKIVPDDWQLMKTDLSECPINMEGNCFWSANVAIRKELFEQVGGFDEDYLIAAQEDQQMKIDIEKSTDASIMFLKECVVVHPVRFTTVMKQIKKIGIASKNFSIYAAKNKDFLHDSRSMGSFGRSQFLFHSRILFASLKAGKIKSSIVTVAWLLYGVPLNMINFSKMLKTQKQGA